MPASFLGVKKQCSRTREADNCNSMVWAAVSSPRFCLARDDWDL